MNNEEPIPSALERIERFLHNEMLPEERDKFLTQLSSDELLRKNVEEMELIFLGIQQAALEQRLDIFHKELAGQTAPPKKDAAKVFLLKKWIAAASVLLIMGIGAWLLFFRQSKNEKLFTQYFHSDPGLQTAMGTSANYSFDRAMVDYKTGNYNTAIKVWDSLQRIHPANDTLNYFLGAAWLANNEPDRAIGYFQKVTATPASVFLKDADWYTGLAYLKIGKKKEAIAFIERSEHTDKAAILRTLK